jgi:hypothetical protein
MDPKRLQLRIRLGEELRLSSEQMEPIWQQLEEAGLIDDFFGPSEFMFEDLVYDARETPEYEEIRAKRKKRAGRPPRELKEYFEVELGEYEKQRAAALSEALAWQAERKYYLVAEFRQDILGGQPLSPGQARDFLESPAIRYFRTFRLREWGIPFIGHKATVLQTANDIEGFRWGSPSSFETRFSPARDRFYSVFVDPPGITKNVLYGKDYIEVPEGLQVDEHYFFEEVDWVDELTKERTECTIRYPGENCVQEARALPGSVLDKLRGLADLLTNLYGWRQEDAVWFVLTGKTPAVSPPGGKRKPADRLPTQPPGLDHHPRGSAVGRRRNGKEGLPRITPAGLRGQ